MSTIKTFIENNQSLLEETWKSVKKRYKSKSKKLFPEEDFITFWQNIYNEKQKDHIKIWENTPIDHRLNIIIGILEAVLDTESCWNYRVIYHSNQQKDEQLLNMPYLAIHEVYYDTETGKPHSFSSDPAIIMSDYLPKTLNKTKFNKEIANLHDELLNIEVSLYKPILFYDNFKIKNL